MDVKTVKSGHVGISILLFVLLAFNPGSLIPLDQTQIFAIATAVMIFYLWVTEALELPITSLSILIIAPLFGIISFAEAAAPFAHPIIFLFMGGFIVGISFEKWNLHRRIALYLISSIGFQPRRMILSFMLATAFLSMWISNTATTIIMLPIALSIIGLLDGTKENTTESVQTFGKALTLCIAFSATLGGNGTLIGSPPNALLVGYLQNLYSIELTFFDWMLIGVPFTILSFIPTYYLITRIFKTDDLRMESAESFVQNEIKKLGSLSRAERSIIIVLGTAILLLILRMPINQWIGKNLLSDSMIIMAAAISFFIIPADRAKSTRILQWSDTEKMSWGVLLLFGGALSLANMLNKVGLIELLGTSISSLGSLEPLLLLCTILLIVLIITEAIGGTALSSVFLPTSMTIAMAMNIDLLYFVVPITLAANVAYLTPVGTAPNAIVFSKNYVHIKDMAKVGIGIKLISFILLLYFVTWWVELLFT